MRAGKWVYWVAAILWVPAGVLVGYAVRGSDGSAQFEQVDPAAVPEKAFPGVRINYVGGGTFKVPAQVTPGTYIVTASGLTFGCAWIRLKADDDKPKSVIDSGTVNRGGFDRFTVGSGDRVLKLLGDCTWARL
jgi:hypothetical protein